MRIALLADTHVSANTPAFDANARAALAWAGAAGADLIVHLGDISLDGHHDPAQLAHAAELFSVAPAPIRFVPGNHDIGDNPVPSLAASHGLVVPERLDLYRATFGEDRWRLDADGWTLIGLNAQLFGFGDEREDAQFAWLEGALAGVDGPVGLVLHKPLFRDGWDDAELHPRYAPIAARTRLRRLLAPRDLRFVASGHTHQWRRLAVEGVEHVWVPSSAFIVPDLMQEWIGEKRVGALVIELTAEAHRVELAWPPGLVSNNLAQFPDVYPGLAALLDQLRGASPADPG
jgi:3',5'-cyclic AMP phosphodiesterase CpdA